MTEAEHVLLYCFAVEVAVSVVGSPENPRKQTPTMQSESRGPQGSPRDGSHGWAWAHPVVTAASHLRTTVASGEEVGGARGPPRPPRVLSAAQLCCLLPLSQSRLERN